MMMIKRRIISPESRLPPSFIVALPPPRLRLRLVLVLVPGRRWARARAALPTGHQPWPAIWMLPAEKTYGGWPLSGVCSSLFVIPSLFFWRSRATRARWRAGYAVAPGYTVLGTRCIALPPLRYIRTRSHPPSFATYLLATSSPTSDHPRSAKSNIMEARGNGLKQCVWLLPSFALRKRQRTSQGVKYLPFGPRLPFCRLARFHDTLAHPLASSKHPALSPPISVLRPPPHPHPSFQSTLPSTLTQTLTAPILLLVFPLSIARIVSSSAH
ncbi:hypothetical protein B0H17DRAFT_1331664 [Mycena rosella]|uniref:Uncharacterized protein n=1 Tax=Mycena rosella TaxID=1033263 RepID=A0AAD7GDM0_MYCRO|nr:hypothetical protein B0H17DRAFT_1331664 [Mycena rosella]